LHEWVYFECFQRLGGDRGTVSVVITPRRDHRRKGRNELGSMRRTAAVGGPAGTVSTVIEATAA
jgi:hypothetical protein